MNATRPLFIAALAALALAACQQQRDALSAHAASADKAPSAAELLAHGEYLVKISGCNDCHTAGYPEAAGQIPKDQWLLGSTVGWNGPWGTTYPSNLRMTIGSMDEAAWLQYSGALHARPPMPDFVLRAMTEQDRLALYRFVRSLGTAGEAAPAYLPPGETPPMPYVKWVLPAPPEPVAAVGGEQG